MPHFWFLFSFSLSYLSHNQGLKSWVFYRNIGEILDIGGAQNNNRHRLSVGRNFRKKKSTKSSKYGLNISSNAIFGQKNRAWVDMQQQ